MMGSSLEAEDDVSRSIIFWKAFINSIHMDEHLFVFERTAEDGGCHESAIARKLAKENSAAHGIGCKIAAIQNARTAERCADGVIPLNKRRYYCGFRTGKVAEMTLRGDKYHIQLVLDGKTDEPSHVDVILFVDSIDRSERNTIKTDAGMALADAFGPAVEHICSEDEADDNHPLKRNPQCLREGLPRFIQGSIAGASAASTPSIDATPGA